MGRDCPGKPVWFDCPDMVIVCPGTGLAGAVWGLNESLLILSLRSCLVGCDFSLCVFVLSSLVWDSFMER